jgi:hypothetical protein
MYDGDYITLKWGTLKAWRLKNPALKPWIDQYNDDGMNVSAMAQKDTSKQKEAICEMIKIINKPVMNDWSGEYMPIDEAIEYVMNYRA